MPKGGLLHAHLDAMVDVQVLLNLLPRHSVYHISVTHEHLSADNLSLNIPQIRVIPPTENAAKATSITSERYRLGTWVPYNQARENFTFGGPEGFDKWLASLMTINPEEAYKTYNTSSKVLNTFSSDECGVKD